MPTDRWPRALFLLACIAAVLLPDAALAAPARTVTFLGIFKDGRPLDRVEAAVKRRLELLEISVRQPSPRISCQAAECLGTAAPGAALVLTGRVLQAPLGCVTKLWLQTGPGLVQEREIFCGVEWSQEDLGAILIREIGQLMEAELIQPIESMKTPNIQRLSTQKIELDDFKKYSKWKSSKNGLLIASSLALIGTTVTFGIMAGLNETPSPMENHHWNTLPGMKATGTLLAIEAAGLIVLTIVP